METRHECCANCRYFCQQIDPENRLYFDEKTGECRAGPPRDHFVWLRTRLYHWCGQWQPKEDRVRQWLKTSAHKDGDEAVLLFRKGAFCQQSGFIVGYWNSGFSRWHDGGDQLLEREQISHWMKLPDPPSS
jgi:hypothetical protein